MKISITPRKLKGTIWVPPSKSQAHRLIIGAALADGVSHLSNLAESQDIRATLNCMQCLGASVSQDGSEITGVRLGQDRGPLPVLDCGESGSTIRFLMPVALAVAGGGVFLGRGRLLERPYGPYEAIFQQQGITFQRQPDSITLSGALKPGRFEVPGDVSSQFITGLLYALPLLDGESEIVLTTALESRGYVDLTLEALKQFGVQVSFTEHGWQVPGGQRYQSADVAVEGDYSQAANFILAASLGNPLQVEGLRPDSAQGDRHRLPVCSAAGWRRRGDAGCEPMPGSGACPGSAGSFTGWRGDPNCRRCPAAAEGERPAGCGDSGTEPPGRTGGTDCGYPDDPRRETVPRRQLQLPPGPPHCHDAGRGSYLCQRCGRGERSGACGQILPDILGGLQAVGRTVLPDHVRRRV